MTLDEAGRRVVALEDAQEQISDRLYSLEEWRKPSDGVTIGAEVRLQKMEGRIYEYDCAQVIPALGLLRADVDAVQKIADNAIKVGVNEAVNATLDARERTLTSKFNRWTPIIVALFALLGVVATGIFSYRSMVDKMMEIERQGATNERTTTEIPR